MSKPEATVARKNSLRRHKERNREKDQTQKGTHLQLCEHYGRLFTTQQLLSQWLPIYFYSYFQ